MMESLADEVSKLCFQKYSGLKRTGKPNDNEWTVLSGIVLRGTDETLSVVSLATGTKCLSGSELTKTGLWEKGSRLSDSHAEILCRRSFLRYLYHQTDLVLSSRNSEIFALDENGKIYLQNGISFHFFSSQTPCGDCSIFPKLNGTTDDDTDFPMKKRKVDVSYMDELPTISCGHFVNDQRVPGAFHDIYRTGAKCVATEEKQDLHQPGANYHIVGPLRTKPGRGDPTLSLSCSDKIAKWNAIGIQGALLSLVIPLIRMESFVIGGGCPFSLAAMQRGLYGRVHGQTHEPKILQVTRSFIHSKQSERTQPCPSSIIWCAVPNGQLEVAVEGRKQGATKKKTGNCILVSRRNLLRTFLRTAEKYHGFDSQQMHPKKVTYFLLKQSSISYQHSWQQLKLKSFQAWPAKPFHLQDFVLL